MKNILVIDIGGLFTEDAVRFARDNNNVKYFCEWREAFAGITRAKIGDGLEGIERVDNYESHLDRSDLIWIPDTMCASLTEFLKAHDYPVAGAGAAEKLENNRWYGRTRQIANGLAGQETHKIPGVPLLREFLQKNENYYVKIDAYRETLESFKHTDYDSSEQELDDLSLKLGPYKDDFDFIVEKIMPGKEPGIDGITFDGELLYPAMCGYEEKGVGIIERVYNSEKEMPAALLEINRGFAPEFKKHKTRFYFSVEMKMHKDKIPYPIDLTIRKAAPGTSAIQNEAIDNYTEVAVGLATGVKVNPIVKKKYYGAVSGESSKAEKRWLNIKFPKDMRRWVKFRMAVRRNKLYYACPGFPSVVTVVSEGDTIDQVINDLKDKVKEIKAASLNFDTKGLDDIKQNIQEGKLLGINF